MIVGAVRHFFTFNDTPVVDRITGFQIVGVATASEPLKAAPVFDLGAGGPANSMRVYCSLMSYMSTDGVSDDGYIKLPQGKDFAMIVCGRARLATEAPYLASAPSGGNITFDIGAASETVNEPHPNVRSNRSGYGLVSNGGTRTDNYCSLTQRRSGVDYIFMLARRGFNFEQYVYDDLLDEYLLASSVSESYPGSFDALMYTNRIRFGHQSHAATTDGDLGNCDPPLVTDVDQPQDYYAAAIVEFPHGAPVKSKMLRSMKWHRENWTAGNKEIYPPWVRSFCNN